MRVSDAALASVPMDGKGADMLPSTVETLRRFVATESLLGARLTVARGGTIDIDVALGYAALARAARTDDVFRLYCLVKPLIAVCVMQAHQEGLLNVEDRVAGFVDMRRSPRRDGMTIAQLLSHSSGLPHLCVDPERFSFEESVQHAALTPISPRGWWDNPSYNMLDTWHLLAAVLEAVHSRPISEIFHEGVGTRLGRDGLRLTAPDRDRDRYRALHRRQPGTEPRWSPVDEHISVFDRPNPAYGGFGTGADVVTVLANLIAASRGESALIRPETLNLMLTARNEVNLFAGPPRPWGLGVNVDIARHAFAGGWSRNAFGHTSSFGGFTTAYAFADPENDLAICVRWLGFGPRTNWLMHASMGWIYSDLVS